MFIVLVYEIILCLVLIYRISTTAHVPKMCVYVAQLSYIHIDMSIFTLIKRLYQSLCIFALKVWMCLHACKCERKTDNYRISSNRRPGVYFLRDSADPAFKRLNGAGVYLLHMFLAHAHPRYVAHAEVEIHFSSCDRTASQGSDRHTR